MIDPMMFCLTDPSGPCSREAHFPTSSSDGRPGETISPPSVPGCEAGDTFDQSIKESIDYGKDRNEGRV